MRPAPPRPACPQVLITGRSTRGTRPARNKGSGASKKGSVAAAEFRDVGRGRPSLQVVLTAKEAAAATPRGLLARSVAALQKLELAGGGGAQRHLSSLKRPEAPD